MTVKEIAEVCVPIYEEVLRYIKKTNFDSQNDLLEYLRSKNCHHGICCLATNNGVICYLSLSEVLKREGINFNCYAYIYPTPTTIINNLFPPTRMTVEGSIKRRLNILKPYLK